jgi:hypothetical protein
MPEKESLIPKHGGYRKLKSFQVAQLVYDVTVRFCDRYITKRSRTHDQMVQAARSGVQNIAEGSKASGTSKKTELKLTNVPAPAWKSCAWTMKIFFASMAFACGTAQTPAAKASLAGAARPLIVWPNG